MSSPAPDLSILSKQQRVVLSLLASGKGAREVAQILGVVENTIKFHKTDIYKALGVKSVVQATILFNKLAKADEVSQVVEVAELKKLVEKLQLELAVSELKYAQAMQFKQQSGVLLPLGNAF